MSLPTGEHLVLVYGTLKTGEPNHHVLTDGTNGACRLHCRARTVKKFPLIIASKFNIPFLLYSPGKGHNVEGEVWAVDEVKLAALDELEAHPHFYRRQKELVVECLPADAPQQPKELEVWAYFLPSWRDSLFNELTTPMFNCYSNYGAHGLPYVVSYVDAQKVIGPEYSFNGWIRGSLETYEDGE